MYISGNKFFIKNPRLTLILFLFIFSVVIDLILGWIYIPLNIHSFRSSHDYYHHGLLPDKQVKTTWNAVSYYPFYTNSLGFRDKEIRQIPLKNKQHRILFIGDSHTEGVGYAYSQTFAGIIDETFDTLGIDILNAAVVSYSPKLYYYKTKFLLENVGLQFDELIVCLDISDIQNEIVYKDFKPRLPGNRTKIFYSINKFLHQHSFIFYSISNIIRKVKYNRFYRERKRIEKNPRTDLYYTFFSDFHDSEILQNENFHNIGLWYLNKDIFEKWGREGMILEKWYMAELASLCKENQIDLKVVIYPWPILVMSGDSNNIQVQFWSKFSEDYNVELINLFPLFFKETEPKTTVKKYFIEGDVHFNAAGHKMVADELLKYLK